MGWDVEEICTAVAAQLEQATGMRAYAFPPDNPAPPCHMVTVGAIEMSTITGMVADVTISVASVVARASDRVAHQRIYQALSHNGSGSVRDALWPSAAGDYLGVAGLGFKALRSAPPGAMSIGDMEFLAVEHTLTVIPRRG
jgi:hypothetical protein